MISRFLDRLADTHPRLAVALLCVVAVAGCVAFAAVFVVFVAAAASFILFLGA
jgi:hypothetical protein